MLGSSSYAARNARFSRSTFSGVAEDVEILRGSDQAVKTHGRRPDEHVLQPLLLEGAENPEHLVAVHGP
jgi:hypothetical protein